MWYKGLECFAGWGGRTAPSQSGVCLSFPEPNLLVINGTHADKQKSLPVLPAMEASEISPSFSFSCFLLRVKASGGASWVAISLKKKGNKQIIYCYPWDHYFIKSLFWWNFLHVIWFSEGKSLPFALWSVSFPCENSSVLQEFSSFWRLRDPTGSHETHWDGF